MEAQTSKWVKVECMHGGELEDEVCSTQASKQTDEMFNLIFHYF